MAMSYERIRPILDYRRFCRSGFARKIPIIWNLRFESSVIQDGSKTYGSV